MEPGAESSTGRPTGSTTRSGRRSYDATGRQEEAARRRARIVDEAERLFLDRGFAATSIAEIAEAAEVSPQTVYAAFGSKAGVLSRIVDVRVSGDDADDGLMRERPDFETVMATGVPARERVRAIARTARIVNGRSGPIWRLVDSVAGADRTVGGLLEVWLDRMYDDCSETASRFHPADLRDGVGPDDVADALFVLGGTRTYCSLVFDRGHPPDRYEAWLDRTLAGALLPGGA